MVDIDTVAITDLQVIQQRDTVDNGIVTTYQVNRPVGTLTDGDITDDQPAHIDKCQYMRTGIKGRISQGLEFITVAELRTHKGDAIAMDGATTGDREVVYILGIYPHHTLSPILLEGTQMIDSLVGMGLECRVHIKMEIDIRFQFDRSGEEYMPRGEIYLSATGSRAGINGLLDGFGIIHHTITLGTILHHVIHFRLGKGKQSRHHEH